MRLFGLVLLLFSSVLRAEPSAYLEVALNGIPQRVDEQRFTLAETELRAGVYLVDLIAAELFAGTGVMADADKGIEQSINSLYGAGLRFESPNRNGTKAFILLGYSATELELTRDNSGETLARETFEGFSYGIGLEQQLNDNWPLYLNARLQRHYSAGDIDIDAVGVALRYAF